METFHPAMMAAGAAPSIEPLVPSGPIIFLEGLAPADYIS